MFGTSRNPALANIEEDAVDVGLPVVDTEMLLNVDSDILSLKTSTTLFNCTVPNELFKLL